MGSVGTGKDQGGKRDGTDWKGPGIFAKKAKGSCLGCHDELYPIDALSGHCGRGEGGDVPGLAQGVSRNALVSTDICKEEHVMRRNGETETPHRSDP